MMRMGALVSWIVLASGGCDPINYISVSRKVPASLPESCVIQVLRSAEEVQEAGVSDAGVVYAVLLIPDDLEIPESVPAVTIDEEINEDGEREFVFSMTWVGGKGSPEYRQYAEETMRDWQNRVVARCTRPE